MAEIIDNVTFLRFDYPYDTKFKRKNKTSMMITYNEIYEKLIDNYIPIIRIYYKPLEKNPLIKQPFVILDQQLIAKIDKIKFNKIIGSFDIESLVDTLKMDNHNEEHSIIIDNIVDLFRKRKFDENCYLIAHISGYYETRVVANSLIVNITNRNLKNFI